MCTQHYQRWKKHGDPTVMLVAPKQSRDGTCPVDGCDDPINSGGLCNKHYLRKRKHGTPTGGRPGPSVRKVIDHPDGTRTCTMCGDRKLLQDFPLDPAATKGRRSRCGPCHTAQAQQWYEANRERRQEWARERRVRDAEVLRLRDKERYVRDRSKRIALANDAVHRRRARLREVEVDPRVTVKSLRERDGDLCRYCQRQMEFTPGRDRRYRPLRATVDHLLPISRGGGHTFENTALACRECNVRKNSRTAEEFMRGADGPRALEAPPGPGGTPCLDPSAPTADA